MISFFKLFRFNRSPMVAVISGAAAFTSGASLPEALWMTLAAFCLAVGGFSLDFFADRDLDVEGPRAASRHNPLADGSIPPRAGLVFSFSFLIASFFLTWQVSPPALFYWGVVLIILIGLALHRFETPFWRALTLGALQALYLLMGGSVGGLTPALFILAGMFFCAMFGGRGLTDIRDYPQDMVTRVNTLPKRYGIQHTAQFTAACLAAAYLLSLAAYFTGEFNTLYLALVLVFVGVGLVCALWFAARPTPRLAQALTIVYMVGAGLLITLAMVLGKLPLGGG